MSFLSFFNPFARPTAFQIAQQELAEARTALLSSQSAKEWAESQVTYNAARIARLEKAVKELQKLGPVTYDMTFKFENTAHKPPFPSPASVPPVFTSTEVTTTTKVKNAKPKGPALRTVTTKQLAVPSVEGRQDSTQARAKGEAVNS